MSDRTDGKSAITESCRLEALAQINQALGVEARPVPPDRKHWVYGYGTWSQDEAHSKLWVPKPLMFWSAVLRGGWEESPEQLDDPRLSLALWPDAKIAVRAYLETIAG